MPRASPRRGTSRARGRAPNRAHPAHHPQGRALYAGKRTHPRPHHHAHRPRAHPKARAPSLAAGLLVAKNRIREAPHDQNHWAELGDLLYRKGDFELASRAYRRVQEICSIGPVAHPAVGTLVPVARPTSSAPEGAPAVAVTVPAPEPPAAAPAPTEGVSRVPVLTSGSGRTRAIRLPGTGILVARTSLRDHPEVDPKAGISPTPVPSEPAPAGTERTLSPARREEIRSVLQEDLQRALRLMNEASARPTVPSDLPRHRLRKGT